MSCLRNLLCLGIIIPSVLSFSPAGYSSLPKIPSSSKERNDQAISGIKAAIKNPRYPSFPLVECEFPVLDALNKLGDGSLRSTLEAEGANIEFVKQLVKGLSPPIPFFGGQKVSLFTSSDASKSFVSRLKQEIGTAADVYSLRDRIIPNNVARDEICVFVTPSAKSDYQTAVKFAESESIKAVIIVNGYAKVSSIEYELSFSKQGYWQISDNEGPPIRPSMFIS